MHLRRGGWGGGHDTTSLLMHLQLARCSSHNTLDNCLTTNCCPWSSACAWLLQTVCCSRSSPRQVADCGEAYLDTINLNAKGALDAWAV